MRDNYQTGSLGGYIIVAVLLALALIGGLYGLQRYNASRDADNSTEVARDDGSDRDAATNDDRSASSSTDERSSNDSTKDQNSATSDDRAATDATDDTEKTDSNDDKTLPETGPAETTMTALVLGALTFAGVSYQRSRR